MLCRPRRAHHSRTRGPAAPAAPAAPSPPAARAAGWAGASTSYAETGRWLTSGTPTAVAVDAQGRVLVAMSERVEIFRADGRRLSAFTTDVTKPYGLAVGRNGKIYLGEYGAPGAVHVYSAAGVLESSYVTDDGSFGAWGVEAHPGTGQVWIANANGDTVERVNPAAPAIGGPGTAPGRFDDPLDLAYGSGSMYVVDSGNFRVQRFRADTGAYQGAWGQAGHGRGQFRDPRAIATGLGGVVLVLDSWYSDPAELDAFSPTGQYLGTSRLPLSAPPFGSMGLATDGSGNVYAAGLVSSPRGGWGVVRLSPTATGGARAAARIDATRNRKRAAVRITCRGSVRCTGVVQVTGKGRTLATGRYALRPGAGAAVRLTVTKAGRKALRQRARTKVVIRLTTGYGTVARSGRLTR